MLDCRRAASLAPANRSAILELVNDGEAGVVFAQAGFVIANVSCVNAARGADAVKIGTAQIDVLILTAQMPVIGQRIFQTAAHHPAHSSVAGAAAFLEERPTLIELVELGDVLIVADIADGEATGDVGHHATKAIPVAWPY